MNQDDRIHELIARHHLGTIPEEEHAELELALRDSSAARALFHRACRIDRELARQSESPVQTVTPPAKPSRRFSLLDVGLAAAILVLLGVLASSWLSRPEMIATLVSTENAAWESALPTTPGSKLSAGEMKLTSGLATIRFRSGAEMMLEGPARVSLETPMKARLETGVAILEVPESAIGFVLVTPDGHVVDHGTSFAVSVDDADRKSTVEVIEGEVSLHLADSSDSLRLLRDEAASTIDGKWVPIEEGGSHSVMPNSAERIIRIGTGGRSHSVIRANREKWMHPTKLMVKRRLQPGNHERRAFVSFDLSAIDLDAVETVRLRLNQVPSGIGFASRLPKVSDVAVYGITDPAKADWPQDALWEEGPFAEDGELLGYLPIPRSQQRGSRIFEAPALLEFLKTHPGERVTFLLDGAIDPVTGETVPSMVIAFASDTHAESAGPMLEFVMRK